MANTRKEPDMAKELRTVYGERIEMVLKKYEAGWLCWIRGHGMCWVHPTKVLGK